MGRLHLRDEGKERYWRRHVENQRRGRQTVRSFCRQRGLSEAAFHYWRRELVKRDAARQEKRPGNSPKYADGQLRNGDLFVPVGVTHEGAAGGIELVMPQGCTVRLDIGFDAATLQRALAVLEGRSC